jgi:TPR repeat protein
VKHLLATTTIALLLIGCASPQKSNHRGSSSHNSHSKASCSSGVECQNIGLNYVSRGSHSGYAKASGYFAKSCSYGESEGCNNLAFLYANGRGVSQSYTQAYKYWGKACRMGNSLGCTNLDLAKDKVSAMRRNR